MQCSWQRTWKKSSKSWIFSNGFWAVYLKKWVGLLFDLAQCSKGMNSTGQWTLMRGWKLEDEFRFKTGCIVGYPWLCSLAIAKWAGPVCNCKGLVTSPPSSQNLALNRNIAHQTLLVCNTQGQKDTHVMVTVMDTVMWLGKLRPQVLSCHIFVWSNPNLTWTPFTCWIDDV